MRLSNVGKRSEKYLLEIITKDYIFLKTYVNICEEFIFFGPI